MSIRLEAIIFRTIKITKVHPYRTASIPGAVKLPREAFQQVEDELRKMGKLDNHIVVEFIWWSEDTSDEMAVWLSDWSAYVGQIEDVKVG